jgi:crossover junction endodeoxyribonuclease RusA
VSTFVHGLPETKGSWRAIGAGRLKRDNPREKAWANAVGWAVRLARVDKTPVSGFVGVTLEFFLPRPVRRKNRRDIDKLIRSCLDAMTGIIYVDDEQVAAVKASKVIAEREPGVDIRVVRL